jgi:Holliday junction resolvase RusA-like endonuclease
MDAGDREELSMKFTIKLPPVTKKNHGQIVWRGNRPIMIPSKPYLNYERDAKWFMPKVKTIDYPVNIKCIYYMPTRRKVDLSNLLNATLDLLVHYGILLDDNRNIVYSVDGSRVYYDKDNSRTEIEITRIKGDVELWAKK